eukprot:748192-Rhodomonas_salina.3
MAQASAAVSLGGPLPLRVCYAMPGTDLSYGLLLLPYAPAMRCPALTYFIMLRRRGGRCWVIGPRYQPTHVLCDAQY